jgi:hypothetical protein
MNILAGLFVARAVQLLYPDGLGFVKLNGLPKTGRATKFLAASFMALLIAGPLLIHLFAQVSLTGSQPGLALLRTVFPQANAYEVAKLIVALRPGSDIAQEIMLLGTETALKNSDGISMEGVNFQRELLVEALNRYDRIRAQTANSPAYGVREARTLIQYRTLLESDSALKRAHEILLQNLRMDPFHADSMIALSRIDMVEGHSQQALQLLAVSMQHVLSRRDQQLIAVEILRQRVAPRRITELDVIEKQLRNIRSDSETGKALLLPAGFSEGIDSRLTGIAKTLSH